MTEPTIERNAAEQTLRDMQRNDLKRLWSAPFLVTFGLSCLSALSILFNQNELLPQILAELSFIVQWGCLMASVITMVLIAKAPHTVNARV